MESRIVVVGGGIAGLGAALELGRRGLAVTLVDANETLGGHGARWACMATGRCERCGVCLVHDALAEVERAGVATQLLGWKVTAAELGDSALRLQATHPEKGSLDLTGVEGVVLAAGFDPFGPVNGRPLGATSHPSVVTTESLNVALRRDRLEDLPFGGLERARLAVLHCVGSRDPAAGRGYCSQICCGTAIRAARRLKHLRPGWEVTLFHNDLQVYGKEARLKALGGLRLIQGIPAELLVPGASSVLSPDVASPPGTEVQAAPGGAMPPASLELVFQAPDGQVRSEGFDGALLVVGLVPRPGTARLAQALGLGLGATGFLAGPVGGDPRVVAAGACLAPMGIEASLLSGRAAAARLLGALSLRVRPPRGSVTGSEPSPKESTAGSIGPSLSRPQGAPPLDDSRRTVVVVGAGEEAVAVLAALTEAGLPGLWVQPPRLKGIEAAFEAAFEAAPAGAVNPRVVLGIDRLEGALGDFTLWVRGEAGPDALRCGAVVLCGDLPWELPAGSLDGLSSRAVDRLESGTGEEPGQRLALWLDPAGPPNRAVAARLLAEIAQAQSSGRAAVTLLCEQVSLPGLEAQGHYDQARRAGMRVLRTAGHRPVALRQTGGWALGLTHALVPEVPLRLAVDALLEAARPAPPSADAARLGLGLDREGFAPRDNVRLAPLRSERAGVFVLGAARQEALPGELADQRQALVVELAALLEGGGAPRPEAAVEIDPGRCIQCFTCVRSCPHQAIQALPRGAPRVWAQACEACGRCVALCPSLAIRARGAPSPGPRTTPRGAAERASQAEALRMAPVRGLARSEGEPLRPGEAMIFACGHSGAPALDSAQALGLLGLLGLLGQPALRRREVPCIAAVSDLDVMAALRAGASRVVMIGCHPGSCNHVDGEAQCGLRVAQLRVRLADLGVSPARVALHFVSPAEPARLARLLQGQLTEGGSP